MRSSVTVKEKKAPLLTRLKNSGCFSPFYVTLMLLFAVSLIIYLLSRAIPSLAEFIARYPSQGVRFLMAKLTSWIPFSLAECLLLLIPVGFAAYLVYSFRFIKSGEKGYASRVIMPLIAIIMVIGILFFSMLGPCYFRNSLSENLGIQDAAVSGEELYETAIWLTLQIDEVIPDITFAASGESHMQCDFNTMCLLVGDAFERYASGVDYISDFSSTPKSVALSEPMTYTHISGVYSFFTGEANINVNYPDFIIPYTIAHEMSHQRGIAREEEANMVAFLVCLESSNSYVRYSALTNVLRYVQSALYKADTTLYYSYMQSYYPPKLRAENNAYSLFFEPYRDNVANNVTNTVNNTFLQTQGQTQGSKSYGLVVDLTVSYYKSLFK